MLLRLALGLRRVMVRTDQSRVRPVWGLLHEALIRGLAAYLRVGQPRSAVYVRGSLGFGEPVYGLSDVDATVVVAEKAQGCTRARYRLRRRWKRLCSLLPPLGELVHLTIYHDAELEKVVAGSPASIFKPEAPPGADPAASSLFFGVPPLADENGMRAGPGLYAATGSWRLVSGAGRRPPAAQQEGHRRWIACWPELQHWWRYLFKACVELDRPHQAHLCVKLVAEPTRIWLWLAHGIQVFGRREALQRALVLMADEEEALRWALDLHRRLPRDPLPPLQEALRTFLRLSSRIAHRLSAEAAPAGITTVRLLWDREADLAVPANVLDPVRALTGREPEPLPLVDWRGLVLASQPDEVLAPVPIEATDLRALTAAAIVGRTGAYPAVQAGGLLILPATDSGAPPIMARRTTFRSVQCGVTDPVSSALLRGEDAARFPNVPGWSAQDWARRGVEERRAWLHSLSDGPDGKGDRLAQVLCAARAGLFLESVERGDPELCLTSASVAAQLGERMPGAGSIAGAVREGCLEYRRSGAAPPAGIVAAAQRATLALPGYRRPARVAAGG